MNVVNDMKLDEEVTRWLTDNDKKIDDLLVKWLIDVVNDPVGHTGRAIAKGELE
jgi:hypothetical protein